MNYSNKQTSQLIAKVRQLALGRNIFYVKYCFKDYLDTISEYWNCSYKDQLLLAFNLKEPLTLDVIKEQTETYKVNSNQESLKKNLQTRHETNAEFCLKINPGNYKNFLKEIVFYCNQKRIFVNFKQIIIKELHGKAKPVKSAIKRQSIINAQLCSIIHDLTHKMLSNQKTLSKKYIDKDKEEILAEGVTYAVTNYLCIDYEDFNYYALFETDYKKLLKTFISMSLVVKEIIGFLDNCIKTEHNNMA